MGSNNSKNLPHTKTKITANNFKESSLPNVYENLRQCQTVNRKFKCSFDERNNQRRQSFCEGLVDPLILDNPFQGDADDVEEKDSYPASRITHSSQYYKNIGKNVLEKRRQFPGYNRQNISLMEKMELASPIVTQDSLFPSKSWSKELLEGIESLAVTRAPTSIDPPDIPFLPMIDMKVGDDVKDLQMEGINDSPPPLSEVESQDETETEFSSIDDNTIPCVIQLSEHSDLECKIQKIDLKNVSQARTESMEDSDCSSSSKFWARHPKARRSGSRVASFMIAPFETTSTTRTKTPPPVINRKPRKATDIHHHHHVRTSVSAQHQNYNPAASNLKTFMSCESFKETNQKISSSIATTTNFQEYELPPSEPLNFIYEEEIEEESEVHDQSQLSNNVDIDIYFTYKKNGEIQKVSSIISSSSSDSNTLTPRNGNENNLIVSSSSETIMNFIQPLVYDFSTTNWDSKSSQSESETNNNILDDDTTNNITSEIISSKKSQFLQTEEEEESDIISIPDSDKTYGIDQMSSPHSELSKNDTYSEIATWSSSEDKKYEPFNNTLTISQVENVNMDDGEVGDMKRNISTDEPQCMTLNKKQTKKGQLYKKFVSLFTKRK